MYNIATNTFVADDVAIKLNGAPAGAFAFASNIDFDDVAAPSDKDSFIDTVLASIADGVAQTAASKAMSPTIKQHIINPVVNQGLGTPLASP